MFDISEIAGHVKDTPAFHVPGVLWDLLPAFMKGEHPHRGTIPLPKIDLFGYEFQVTKFMVLELAAGVLMVLIFVPLARRIAGGQPPRGRFWNLLEAMLLFLRDEVARPAIGRHEADRYLPFLWTLFFFILLCNLLGLVPWAGSPTGALAVTGTLALVSFATVVGSGMARFGITGYWTGMVPEMELPLVMSVLLKPLILAIEVLGLCIKHGVLAVRLLANMFAGHLVLAVIIAFVGWTANQLLVVWLGVAIGSVLGAAALSLLELFVAFLQAYVFTFLSALFIGMAVHPH
ncbi:MAG: F0F1 ATP synthase subunit A [Thermoguttaceae bacterium]